MEKHIQDYLVRADECDRNSILRTAALNAILQESAGHHGMMLGVGMDVLKPRGLTWMLLRFTLNITRFPRWRDTLRVTTWPSGTRGRLIATREYTAHLPPDETPILNATSEWGLVDIREQRIVRLTDDIRALRIPSDLPPQPPLPKIPEFNSTPEPPNAKLFTRSYPIRESQIDFNHHVNNAHYLAWLFDTLPDPLATDRLARLDIAYRLPANIGDTVRVETQHTPGDNTCLHTIHRESDNALLIHAQTTWNLE
jgi:medium-chain acyl-[acyl-carrier-protein] hydrolase